MESPSSAGSFEANDLLANDQRIALELQMQELEGVGAGLSGDDASSSQGYRRSPYESGFDEGGFDEGFLDGEELGGGSENYDGEGDYGGEAFYPEDHLPATDEDGYELHDDIAVVCEICQEDNPVGSMLFLDCNHSFCIPCMAQHGKVSVDARKIPIPCPAPGCKQGLTVADCEACLDGESFSQVLRHLAELTIPENERFFCPYKECSLLMAIEPRAAAGEACATCSACNRLVCISCRVPWHEGATCADFQAAPEDERDPNDFKLKQLADSSMWKRCYKCKQWVERAEGCPHMTCRCKAEFCYGCGAPWVNQRATCKCYG